MSVRVADWNHRRSNTTSANPIAIKNNAGVNFIYLPLYWMGSGRALISNSTPLANISAIKALPSPSMS